MNSTFTGALRLLAHDAHQEAKAQAVALAALERQKQEQQIAKKLKALFNQPVEIASTTQTYESAPIVAADDLRFTLASQGEIGADLVLLDICSECGQETASDPLYTLATLGELLHEFTSATNHDCK